MNKVRDTSKIVPVQRGQDTVEQVLLVFMIQYTKGGITCLMTKTF